MWCATCFFAQVCDLLDVYKDSRNETRMINVSHLNDAETLLVCLGDQNKRMLAALGEMETSGAKKLMEAVAESRPLITSALRVSRC